MLWIGYAYGYAWFKGIVHFLEPYLGCSIKHGCIHHIPKHKMGSFLIVGGYCLNFTGTGMTSIDGDRSMQILQVPSATKAQGFS